MSASAVPQIVQGLLQQAAGCAGDSTALSHLEEETHGAQRPEEETNGAQRQRLSVSCAAAEAEVRELGTGDGAGLAVSRQLSMHQHSAGSCMHPSDEGSEQGRSIKQATAVEACRPVDCMEAVVMLP